MVNVKELSDALHERSKERRAEEQLRFEELRQAINDPQYSTWLYNPPLRKAWHNFRYAARQAERLDNAASVVIAALEGRS